MSTRSSSSKLLKTADASEAFIKGLVEPDFLADQVKMARRACAAFLGCSEISEAVAIYGQRHPHLVDVCESRRDEVKEIVDAHVLSIMWGLGDSILCHENQNRTTPHDLAFVPQQHAEVPQWKHEELTDQVAVDIEGSEST